MWDLWVKIGEANLKSRQQGVMELEPGLDSAFRFARAQGEYHAIRAFMGIPEQLLEDLKQHIAELEAENNVDDDDA